MMNRVHVKRSILMALLVFLVSVLGFSTNAFADASAFKKAASISAEAMAEYDDFEIESAEVKILSAIKIIEDNQINDPNVAKIYVAQGVISYNRWKDSAPTIAEERAYTAFLKASAIDNAIEIPGDYRSTELDQLLERAKTDLSMGKSTAVGMPQPTFTHDAIVSSDRCAPIRVAAKTNNTANVYHVALYYSSDSETSFKSVDMEEDPINRGTFTATVPGTATRGSQVRYYIEAVNKDGEHVGSVGSNYRPYTTVLAGECVGLSDEDLESLYGDPLFQMSVMVGSGIGIAKKGVYLQRSNDVSYVPATGTAWVPLFIRGNAIFNLPANLQLGVYVRGQVIDVLSKSDKWIREGNNKAYPSLMVGADFRYLAVSRQPYRLYVGLQFGWGGATAQVKNSETNKTDIYLFEGQFHVAPEIGFLWTFNKNVGLNIELAVPIHFPKDPSAHFDLSIGPYFQF